MATRVVFRPRARGCAEAGTVPDTGEATASALEPRVKFVKGTTGTPSAGEVAVGSGTYFPMQATLEQVMELFYRVKDAHFDSGACFNKDYSVPGAILEIAFSSAAPSSNYHDYYDDGGGLYFWKTERSWVSAGNNLTDETEIWTESLDAPEEASTVGGDSFDTYMWIANPVHNIVCAFSHYSEIDCGHAYDTAVNGFPSGYFPYSRYPSDDSYIDRAGVELAFNGVVAVTGDGDPFNPANDLYIGLHFEAYSDDGIIIYDIDASTYDAGGGTMESTGISLSLVLNSGTLTADLYSTAHGSTWTYGGNGFVLRATDWWPYAHPNGNPVWNTASGAWTAP